MSIRRTAPVAADHYTVVPNAWARDAALSWKARGLLAYLMSHRVGWETSVGRLANEGTDGRDAVQAGLRELVLKGYLVRDEVRDADGTYKGVDYLIQDPAVQPLTDYPSTGNPPTVQPSTGDPDPKKTISSEDQEKNFSAADASDDNAKAKTRRATRIDSALVDGAFPITERMSAWGQENAPHVLDPARETEQFVDYWTAASGRPASKLDWVAAWRTWMRNAEDRAYRPQASRLQPGRVQR